MKSQILQHRGSTYLLKHYKGSREKFRTIDNVIFDTRMIEEKSIEDYSIAENQKNVASVIVKGISIYGFKPVPDNVILTDTCQTIAEYLIKFKYGHLSWAEIKLALMMNSYTDLKYPSGEDYEPVTTKGNYFNLQFLAAILTRYMIFRNHLDEMIRKMFDGIEPYSLKFSN